MQLHIKIFSYHYRVLHLKKISTRERGKSHCYVFIAIMNAELMIMHSMICRRPYP